MTLLEAQKRLAANKSGMARPESVSRKDAAAAQLPEPERIEAARTTRGYAPPTPNPTQPAAAEYAPRRDDDASVTPRKRSRQRVDSVS